MNWKKSQKWEKEWWGTCQNTFGEELKQLLYADRMGLKTFHDGKSPFNLDMEGKSVLDIGGGPASLLLKCVNVTGVVIDPLKFPRWVYSRYKKAGIQVFRYKGDEMEWFTKPFDEAWIYNVLQHTESPEKVIEYAKKAAKLIRIFEWIDTPINEGHISTLTEKKLNKWLGGEGKVEELKGENTCFGRAYYGVFATKKKV